MSFADKLKLSKKKKSLLPNLSKLRSTSNGLFGTLPFLKHRSLAPKYGK